MKSTITQENMKSTGREFWLWGMGALAAGVTIGIAILFWYTPRAYKHLLEQEKSQVSLYLTHELAPDFYNQVQQDKPFEMVISQSGINEMASQWDWPQEFGDLSFSDPYIIFSDDTILLMGTLVYEGVSSVISISAFPTMNADGTLTMNIQSIRLGMVPVKTLVTKLAQKAFDDNRGSFEGYPKAEENVQAVIRNEPVDPVFRFSDHRVRITHFSIEEGSLKLTLSPEAI